MLKGLFGGKKPACSTRTNKNIGLNKKAKPAKMNMGSKPSPKFNSTDLPIRKAIKTRINPNKRFVNVFFFLKMQR